MDRRMRLGVIIRWLAVSALLGAISVVACAGADGDPAPVPPEGGTGVPGVPCVDAGTE